MSAWLARAAGALSLGLVLTGCFDTATPKPQEDPVFLYPATPEVKRKIGPLKVGIQSGHWKMNELPNELARLRDNQGAYAAGVFERDVNLSVARELQVLLKNAGYDAQILPGTIPPGYEADAFVSLHADWSFDGRRGWKLAVPWRHSPYAAVLKDSLIQALRAQNWPDDMEKVSINMRGYHAFNYRRYVHSVDRYTPAVIIEMGMMTNYLDRRLLSTQPWTMASVIFQGLQTYFKTYDRNRLDHYKIPEIPNMTVRRHRTLLRTGPQDKGIALLYLPKGERLYPLGFDQGWTEVYVRGRELMGWVESEHLEAAAFPWPGGPPVSYRRSWFLIPDPAVPEVEPPLRGHQSPGGAKSVPGTYR